jgi:small subunit ribosomal protein S1
LIGPPTTTTHQGQRIDMHDEPINSDYADPEDAQGSAEFAQLLDAAPEATPTEPKPGDKVTGTIVRMDDAETFVDIGSRSELPIATAELLDLEGKPHYAVGDTLTAYVIDRGGDLGLTTAFDGKDLAWSMLEEAVASGVPVEGKITGTNKGGLSVELGGGKRGFCPFSQIDLRRVEDPERFLGRTERFRILELGARGRNVVLSRRAILEAERADLATTTRERLVVGAAFTGHVTRLVPYGAFVDIGGVEGLVHISQISHARVSDPAEVLREGQDVQVQVLELQNLGRGREERISLSIKALAQDPWPATAESLAVGSDVPGKVVRLADFGAFVELIPGVEGLVHVSELSSRRIMHPREAVSEGDEITVRIVDVDLQRRRISLSRKQAGDFQDD